MFEIDNSRMKVKIDLDNGVYVFDPKSATGKTRLSKLLRRMQLLEESVAAYDYDCFLNGDDIRKTLTPNKYHVIILDRFDMYKQDISKELNSCADNSIILIDCKSELNLDVDVDICFMKMENWLIEVSRDEVYF